VGPTAVSQADSTTSWVPHKSSPASSSAVASALSDGDFLVWGVDVLATFFKGDKVEPRVFIKHIIIDGANIDAKLPKT
jgi:hypothetical protein